jgi:hypothetical protein
MPLLLLFIYNLYCAVNNKHKNIHIIIELYMNYIINLIRTFVPINLNLIVNYLLKQLHYFVKLNIPILTCLNTSSSRLKLTRFSVRKQNKNDDVDVNILRRVKKRNIRRH